jgi:hypothetical protein
VTLVLIKRRNLDVTYTEEEEVNTQRKTVSQEEMLLRQPSLRQENSPANTLIMDF